MAKDELEKDPQTIRRLFDDISPTYDVLNHTLSMSIDVGWRKRTLKELNVRDDETILDIASGTGDMALLANSLHGCRVIGVDLSGNMLKVATEKCSKKGDFYTAIEGDALHMPFDDGSFEKAMVAFGIRNMPDMAVFLKETNRVLRPGGKLAILEFSVPEYPVVRQIYLAYLTKVLPFVGGLQSGNRGAYQYLSDSINRFPSPASMETLYKEQGFVVETSVPLTLGISHLYVLRRPS